MSEPRRISCIAVWGADEVLGKIELNTSDSYDWQTFAPNLEVRSKGCENTLREAVETLMETIMEEEQ